MKTTGLQPNTKVFIVYYPAGKDIKPGRSIVTSRQSKSLIKRSAANWLSYPIEDITVIQLN